MAELRNVHTMHLCALEGNEAFIGNTIKKLIEKGADPDAVIDHDGTTLLMKHVEELKSFNVLLKNGASPDLSNKKGETVLMYAAKEGSSISTKQLLKYKASVNLQNNNGVTALMLAAISQNMNTVKELLKHDAQIDIKDNKGENALMYAVKVNNPEMIKLLIENGFDPNEQNLKGETVLYLSVTNDTSDEENYENVPMLIEMGADVNKKNKNGYTALHRAIPWGFLKTMKCLLENNFEFKNSDTNFYSFIDHTEDTAEVVEKLLDEFGAGKPSFIIRYKSKFTCKTCGRTVALNNPAERVHCIYCQTMNTVPKNLWKGFIKFTHRGFFKKKIWVRIKDENEIKSRIDYELKIEAPLCFNPECKTPLSFETGILGNEAVITCKECGLKSITFPSPDWFKGFDLKGSTPIQIFCEKKENDGKKETKFNANVVNCVSCGASMKFSEDKPRLCICEHCGTNQYLTDTVWKELHPVKVRKPWYIFYK